MSVPAQAIVDCIEILDPAGALGSEEGILFGAADAREGRFHEEIGPGTTRPVAPGA